MAASRVAHRPGGSVAQGKRLTSPQLPNAARPRGAALVAETPRLGSPSAGVPHPERATHSPPSALPCGGARAHGAAPPPPGRALFTDRDLPHVSTRPSLLPMTRAAARAPQRPTSTRALQPAAAGGRRPPGPTRYGRAAARGPAPTRSRPPSSSGWVVRLLLGASRRDARAAARRCWPPTSCVLRGRGLERPPAASERGVAVAADHLSHDASAVHSRSLLAIKTGPPVPPVPPPAGRPPPPPPHRRAHQAAYLGRKSARPSCVLCHQC